MIGLNLWTGISKQETKGLSGFNINYFGVIYFYIAVEIVDTFSDG